MIFEDLYKALDEINPKEKKEKCCDNKDNHSLEDRISESSKIMNKNPSRIPIIVEKSAKCMFDDIDKSKYLEIGESDRMTLLFMNPENS